MYQIGEKFDIRQYKKELRARFKGVRGSIPPDKRAEKDAKILEWVRSLPEYKSCKTLLCYVSMQNEADTKRLIQLSLKDGKTVAVPRCVENSRDMDFYRISSLDELSPRTFGVLEPPGDADRLMKETDFSRSLCILPGLAFDMNGYRLGYGGGYYDRFLSGKYSGDKRARISVAGICYSECTLASIRHGRYDMKCGVVVTDLFVKRVR